jgi:hypothetical protein
MQVTLDFTEKRNYFLAASVVVNVHTNIIQPTSIEEHDETIYKILVSDHIPKRCNPSWYTHQRLLVNVGHFIL